MTAVIGPPMSFVKLYGAQLCTSSLWDEPAHVRIVFLWFLVNAGHDGRVPYCSATAVSRLANVPIGDAEAALVTLTEPDPRSRTPEHDGRRLVRDGDFWVVVNAVKYRDYRSQKQVAAAERQKKHRTRKSRTATRAEREVEAWDKVTGKKDFL